MSCKHLIEKSESRSPSLWALITFSFSRRSWDLEMAIVLINGDRVVNKTRFARWMPQPDVFVWELEVPTVRLHKTSFQWCRSIVTTPMLEVLRGPFMACRANTWLKRVNLGHLRFELLLLSHFRADRETWKWQSCSERDKIRTLNAAAGCVCVGVLSAHSKTTQDKLPMM